jgi:hypothetical protein
MYRHFDLLIYKESISAHLLTYFLLQDFKFFFAEPIYNVVKYPESIEIITWKPQILQTSEAWFCDGWEPFTRIWHILVNQWICLHNFFICILQGCSEPTIPSRKKSHFSCTKMIRFWDVLALFLLSCYDQNKNFRAFTWHQRSY